MRFKFLSAVVFVATTLSVPATASADTLFGLELAASPACTAVEKSATFNYTNCLGAFLGNDSPENLSDALNSFDQGPFSFQGQSDEPVGGLNNPFKFDPAGQTGGLLEFVSAPAGPFVIILKSGTAFSMYYFLNDNAAESVMFDMKGTALNKKGDVKQLSHASLYLRKGDMNVVPEPSTYALMATGMIGLVGFARRRRQA